MKSLRIASGDESGRFFLRRKGKLYATQLFIVLLAIEFTDILFALDSIPAILAITQDPFIVLTSNVFAILGLRALYFLLQPMMKRLRYLPVGLGVILLFMGFKMLASDIAPIPTAYSLLFILIILTATIFLSLRRA